MTPRTCRLESVLLVLLLVELPAAWAGLPGGGPTTTDCFSEFASPVLRLNYPPYDPGDPKPSKEIRCFDGDAGCDQDGQVNGSCAFPVDVCLFNTDAALPACTPAAVTAVSVADGGDPDLIALGDALGALVPASSTQCTSGRLLHVPLRGPTPKGLLKAGKKKVSLKATTGSGPDVDKLKLSCLPREWPSHGYTHRNTRAAANETILSPANAASMVVKWTLDLKALENLPNNAVTATPTVGNGLVYVASWNGNVYGVKASNGSVKWKYATGATSPFVGSQSSPLLTADGRLIFGDSASNVHCLRAKTGQLLWKVSVGNLAVDHIWSSAQVVGGRVFIGVASHNDQPCTQGRLVALDLDTGATLWTRTTVPDRVCHNDTAITCTTDVDCGGGVGDCIQARGAGVTATVAVEPTGATVYMATVGCYTFPSIGDSDSVFSLDAATGAVNWKYRTEPIEQFPKPFYHDFGFLNGPLLIDGDDGAGGTRPLVVAASKDGTLYAFNPDGTIAWTNPLIPPPAFAAFGLFDGATGFADHRFYSALHTVADGGAWPGTNDHLYAFSDLDGSVLWHDQIRESWGSMAVANGLLFVGNNAAAPDPAEYYVYDATTGSRLKTFSVPAGTSGVSSGASIVHGTAYVGYGVFGGQGGVMALGLP